MVIAAEIIAWTALSGCALSFCFSIGCMCRISKYLKQFIQADKHAYPLPQDKVVTHEYPIAQPPENNLNFNEIIKTTAELKLVNCLKKTQEI